MKKETRRLSAIRDAGRLINLRDVLARVGTILYRRSLRYGLIALGISVVGFIAHQLGLPGLSKKQAIGFPIVVGTGACLLGLMLRFIPTVISVRLQTVAQAADINLMEDYRKGQVRRYLEALWDRVYRFEAELLYGEEERKAELVKLREKRQELCRFFSGLAEPIRRSLEPLSEEELADLVLSALPRSTSMPKTKEGFVVEGRYVLHSFKTQTQERYETGVDFSALEDWLDGAFFDRSDTKLVEQYAGDPVLAKARGMVRIPLRLQLSELLLRAYMRFWLLIATRALALEVATAVEYLNALYGVTCFNAQTLLWPGAELEEQIRRLHAEEPVRRWRQRVMRRVFGTTPEESENMVDRMFLGTYAVATHLRMYFDPEYLDGSLGYDLCGDIRAEGCCDEEFYRSFAERSARHCRLLEAYLKAWCPGVLQNREGMRAVRIAFHVNRFGFKEDFFNMRQGGSQTVRRHLDRALRRTERYTIRLRRVRQFHELARLQLAEYRRLVGQLQGW